MATYTPNLNLYKKDPVVDGNDMFNITTMMNDNWDKVEAVVSAKETPAGSQAKADVAQTAANVYSDTKAQTNLMATNSSITATNTTVLTHKTSADHDAQYYNKTLSDAKYETMDDLTNNRKLDANGNYTGSWFGISNPVQADPGIAGVVAGHTAQLAETTSYPLLGGEVGVINKTFPYSNILRYFTYADIDCTQAILNSIASGNKKFYFPKGNYKFSLDIAGANSTMEFFGDGPNNTYFVPISDTFVFRINSTTIAKQYITIHDVTMTNNVTFLNAIGISIYAGGAPSTVNDNHNFYNLLIQGFKYNFAAQDRLCNLSFRDSILLNALVDNLHIDSTDNVTFLYFEKLIIMGALRYGVYLKHDVSGVILVTKFVECSVEFNGSDGAIPNNGGVYLYNVRQISFDTCYIENNAVNSPTDGMHITSAGDYCEGLSITSSLLWGTTIAFNFASTNFNGSIRDSRLDGRRIFNNISLGDLTIDGCTGTSLIEETPNVNNGAHGYHSLSPLVLRSKWIPSGGFSAKDTNIFFNSAIQTLATITDGVSGQLMYILEVGNALTVTQTGNIILKDASDFILSTQRNTLSLIFNGTEWNEIART